MKLQFESIQLQLPRPSIFVEICGTGDGVDSLEALLGDTLSSTAIRICQANMRAFN